MKYLSLFFAALLFAACTTTHKTAKTLPPETSPQQTVKAPTVQEETLPAVSSDFKLDYEKFVLDNGLEVILHVDDSDPIIALATIFHVGSNREKPGKTGFAHFFEHMAFNDSENTPVGANRKLIPEWGGQRNGGTWSDGTIYYEVVPKDAFDKILWIDSDRLGYMINTVTEAALEREKQVVKNEKRQRSDNRPYGHTNEVIRSNLYPEDHPYHWTVIGSLPDLQAATLDDVKEFYQAFYGPNNATLVIAGDIDIEETRMKVEQWFGEIKRGPEVPKLEPQPVSLTTMKKVYYEDNFAKLPELRMVFPTVERFHPDTYPLDILSDLLSGSKKAPIYQILVEEKKLAPNPYAYQSSNEIAGEFVLVIRGNEAVDLNEINEGVQEGMNRFETNGFTDDELNRIKAKLETDLYRGIETVLNKANRMANNNEFSGDPAQVIEHAQRTLAVTREDVMRVYNKYIKGKPYLMTNFVPKGQKDLIVTGSTEAEVWQEEVIEGKEEEEVSQGEEAEYEKTPSDFDRSEPDFGEPPLFKMPAIWKGNLSNGMKVSGIKSDELPLVEFSLTIDGGHLLDPLNKSGTGSLLADLMMEGTQYRTAAEMEEAIGLLGAEINVGCSNEELTISGRCLSRNFEKTLKLLEEILLQPAWDPTAFERVKSQQQTWLKGRESNPRTVASIAFNRLLYGSDHLFGTSVYGTPKTVASITMEDLKQFYSNLSPKLGSFHVVGLINKDEVMGLLASLNQNWKTATTPALPSLTASSADKEGKLYFIDVPGSKQSVIMAGRLTVPTTHPDHNNLKFSNEILGGGSSGKVTQILRIEKGYTYGAYSFLRNTKEESPFIISSSVRANATLLSLEIIQELLEGYASDFTDQDAATTQNKVLKRNTLAYESIRSKLGILRTISKYGKSDKFLEEDQKELIEMGSDSFQNYIKKYLKEENMIYLIVGDADKQLENVKKLGKGDPIMLDIYGNPIP